MNRLTLLPVVAALVAGGSVQAAPGPLEASFAQRSYAPGATALLKLRGPADGVSIQIYRAGSGHEGPLQGAPVSAPFAAHGSTVAVRLGAWPSGLYYARAGGWYAPFVLRPVR